MCQSKESNDFLFRKKLKKEKYIGSLTIKKLQTTEVIETKS